MIRKAQGLAESVDPEAQRFGQRVLNVFEALMDSIYKAREGPKKDKGFVEDLNVKHAIRLGKFWSFCVQHENAEHEKTRALARELMNNWNAIWAVLGDSQLPLTNNEAERALRHWVISRRISFGTRTPQESSTFALLASARLSHRK